MSSTSFFWQKTIRHGDVMVARSQKAKTSSTRKISADHPENISTVEIYDSREISAVIITTRNYFFHNATGSTREATEIYH